jgi:hypothetical protein
VTEIRKILSTSAYIIFFLIHIPLSRFSSLFSILTAIIPCILDKRSKENIYLGLNRVIAYITLN